MKISEFKRWLVSQGVRFEEGGKHWRLYLGDQRSHLPRHPSQELSEGLRHAILKQLGLK